MIIEVDMIRYSELTGEPYECNNRFDYSHDYEEMDVTPEKLKWLIDNCVDIKIKNNDELY